MKLATRFDADGKILQSGVGLGTGKNVNHASDILAMLVLQNGFTMTQGKSVTFGQGLGANTAKHPMLEAMRFYTDFAQPTKDVYSWNNDQQEALLNFARGRSVFYFGFAFDRERIRALAPQLTFEVIPVPQLNESQPVNVANYWLETVTSKSKHKDEAWDFIRFITNAESVQKYSRETGRPSPFRAHLSSQKDHATLGPFAVGLLSAQNWYRGRSVASAEEAIENMIDEYLEPYGEDQATEYLQLSRDAGVIQKGAAAVQRTM